jgi:hypothetical protein
MVYLLHTALIEVASRADSSGDQGQTTNCNWNTCPLSDSYWGYRPSLAANLTFLILFAISTLVYVGQGFLNKAWLGFTIAMVCGCLLEVIGYIGRVLAYNNGFTEVRWRDLRRETLC